MEQLKKAFDFVDSHKSEMISLWEDLVNTESGSKDKELVDNLAVKLKKITEAIGMDTKIVEYQNGGNSIVAEIGANRNRKGIVFSGHMDTVFKKDTIKDNPFRIEAGKAYGPGVLDMKGGIVIALYAIKALNSIGYNDRPIKLIISGDEETGHSKNPEGAQLFINECKGFTAAFNFETGFLDNGLVVGRKGVAQYTLEIKGVSAHAGNAPEKGRSAIEELAHKVLDIQSLTNWEEGTTFNVGTIQAGTVSNAIPDYAKAEIDVRYAKVSKKDEITKSLEKITASTYIDGTNSKLTIGNFMYPMETTSGVISLFELAKNTSMELGLGEVYPKTIGGGSDASNIVIAGVPTLCALGVKGEWNHTPREYAIVESLFERAKLILACVMNLKEDLI